MAPKLSELAALSQYLSQVPAPISGGSVSMAHNILKSQLQGISHSFFQTQQAPAFTHAGTRMHARAHTHSEKLKTKSPASPDLC